MTVLYIAVGSIVFYFIERPNERFEKSLRMSHLHQLESVILEQLYDLARTDTTQQEWRKEARSKVRNLSIETLQAFEDVKLTDTEIIENKTYLAWSFPSAIFFSTIAITTIGYGNLVPRTLFGKIFCLFYALFGIPLCLVTIADMSKFLALFIHRTAKRVSEVVKIKLSSIRRFRRRRPLAKRAQKKISRVTGEALENLENFDIQAPPIPIPPMVMLSFLIGYILTGALIYSKTESWNFLPSFYFCFITMSTIGFGDMVPSRNEAGLLLISLIYVLLGLVLTTMSVDIVASHYIREIHFVGRKITNVKELMALLGGKAASVSEIMANMKIIQRQCGLTDSQIQRLLQHSEFRDFISKPSELMYQNNIEMQDMVGPFTPFNLEGFRYIDHQSRKSTICGESWSLTTSSTFEDRAMVHKRSKPNVHF